MKILSYLLPIILILELWALWSQHFHEGFLYKSLDNIEFYVKVLCGYICLFCFDQESTVTMTSHDGEILRQVFIGS